MTGIQNHKLAILMDKLRIRGPLQRSWNESIKAIRVAMADKRHQSDAVDRPQLQRWLDTLQKAMKVLSQLNLVEQLEAVARQVGLSFTPPSGPESQLFVGSDMFYIQVAMDKTGMAKDVKIAHQGEPKSCQDLQDVLSRGDFSEFTSHLEGLCQIYNISGDKKQKTKTFLALQSLECDLSMLAQLQSIIVGDSNIIFRSPLGILLPRKGGRPMKLIYFVSPYDLLDRKTKIKHPLTIEAITEYQLGHSVTVSIEHSSLNRLQTMPLMTVVKNQDGKSLPSFSGLSNMNSCMLPACFVLTLRTPLTVLASLLQKIESITNMEVPRISEGKKLLSLLIETISCQRLFNKKELYVTLPDQQHVYFLGGHQSGIEEEGVLISKIPFTHPTNLPKILSYLRQQMLFNTAITSCIRPSAKRDLKSALVFELSALSLHQVNVSFEHPLQDSMVTAEFDMSDITNLKCRVCTALDGQSFCSDEYASKVFHQCMSIPVSLRAILNKVLGQLKKTIPGVNGSHVLHNMNFYSKHMSSFMSVHHSRVPSISNDYRFSLSHLNYPHHYVAEKYKNNLPYLDPAKAPQELLDDIRADKVAQNPLLATLLDQDTAAASDVHNSPMLSKLLDDHTTATACMTNPTKVRKGKKRRAASEIIGRSPKQKHVEENDIVEEDHRSLIEIDSSSPSLSSALSNISSPPEHTSGSMVTIDLTENGSLNRDNGTKRFSNNNSSSYLNNLSDKCFTKSQNMKGEMVSIMLEDIKPDVIIKKESEKSKCCHNLNSMSRNGVSSLEDLFSDSGQPINPDEFTNKAQMSSNDFLENGTLSRTNCELQTSTYSGETLDFGNDLLNPVSVYPVNDDEDICLEKCDKIAFGTEINNFVLGKSSLLSNSSSSNLEKSGPGNSRPIPILEKLGEDVKGERDLIKHKSSIESEAKVLTLKEESKFDCSNNVMKIRLCTHELKKSENWNLVQDLEVSNPTKGKESFELRCNVESKDFPNDSFNRTLKNNSPLHKHSVNVRNKEYHNSDAKSDKSKKKESKHNSANNDISGKRRKEESKKERKKRKQEKNDEYSEMVQGAVYRSTQVESSSDSKPMPKLKITKSFLKLSVDKKASNLTDSSKRSLVSINEKVSSKYDSSTSEKCSRYEQLDKLTGSYSTSHCSNSSNSKESEKCPKPHRAPRSLASSSHSSQNITVNKADSKLMTKTPTVKLKPLVMPVTSGSSVNVSSVRTPSVYSNATHSGNKTTTTTVATSTILSTSAVSSLSSTSPVTPSATLTSRSLTSKMTASSIVTQSTESSTLTNSPHTENSNSSNVSICATTSSSVGNISSSCSNFTKNSNTNLNVSSCCSVSSNNSGNNTSKEINNAKSISTTITTTGTTTASITTSTTTTTITTTATSTPTTTTTITTSITTTNAAALGTSSTSTCSSDNNCSSSTSCSNPTINNVNTSTCLNKTKAAIRSRKGSLSAVIDKLTKTSTTNVRVSSANDGDISARSNPKEVTPTDGDDDDDEDDDNESFPEKFASKAITTMTLVSTSSKETLNSKIINKEVPVLSESRHESVDKKELRCTSKRDCHLSVKSDNLNKSTGSSCNSSSSSGGGDGGGYSNSSSRTSSSSSSSCSSSSCSSNSSSSSSNKQLSNKSHKDSRSATSSTSKTLSRENGCYAEDMLELSSPSRSQSPFLNETIKFVQKKDVKDQCLESPQKSNENSKETPNVHSKLSSDWDCSQESSRSSENLEVENKGRYISENSSKSWNRLDSVVEESGWCSNKHLNTANANIKQSSEKTCFDNSNSSGERDILDRVLNNCRDLDSSNAPLRTDSGTKVHTSIRRIKGHSQDTKFNGENEFSKIYESHVHSALRKDEEISSEDFEKQKDFTGSQDETLMKKKTLSSLNPVSPGSDASSPENGLIIDYASSPKNSQLQHQVAVAQHQKHPPIPAMSSSKVDSFKSHDSKHKFSSRSPTPSPRQKNPLPLSPSGVREISLHSNSTSVSSSPIDNDLMDEALMITY